MTAMVSPAGGDMITVARALVRGGPYAVVEPILFASSRVPGIGEEAMRVFEDTLAKGCVRVLAREGGWRNIARRTGSGVTTGRLWQTRAAKLTFSKFTFELCRWLVSQPLGGGEKFELLRTEPKTNGDELVAYLACALVEEQAVERVVAAQPGVRASALAWLGFTRMLGTTDGAVCAASKLEALPKDDVLIEGLELDLARRAGRFERDVQVVREPQRLLALGRTRETILDAFVGACLSADRLDLATFLVESAAAASLPKKFGLDRAASLRDRLEAQRAAGAQLRVLGRLAREHEKARMTSFIDEGYATAQLLLARWEHVGKDGFDRAAAALSQLESWDSGG